jgi:hypothetical protein
MTRYAAVFYLRRGIALGAAAAAATGIAVTATGTASAATPQRPFAVAAQGAQSHQAQQPAVHDVNGLATVSADTGLTNGFDIIVSGGPASFTVVSTNLPPDQAEWGPAVGQVIDSTHRGHVELIYDFFGNTTGSVTLQSSRGGDPFTIDLYLNPLRLAHIGISGQEGATSGKLPDGSHWHAPGFPAQSTIYLGQ